ncbi:MAG TPA: nitrogen regulation protein NR(II) [Burkholderiaceae bacterium]|nr:nitrogen regulation protein NR(II) [Burkholderiaceae bacterium]
MSGPTRWLSLRRPAPEQAARYAGLELLSTAVMVIDADARVVFANQAAEHLFEVSRRILVGQLVSRLFVDEIVIDRMLAAARANDLGQRRQLLELRRPLREPLAVQATATALYDEATPLILELIEIQQQLKVSREEHNLDLSEASRRLLRSLAHEIKNPLGGIRGAAQLLESELPTREQREYTRVVISEADRLQALVDRLLEPHRSPRVIGQFSVHEVTERVRSVILAEFPRGLTVTRDYDASAPELRGDREQLIQAVLNVVRNAAQALAGRIAAGDAEITLITRVARHVTLARRLYRLALELHVIDNGPGIADALKPHVFYPLVSGRDGGNGLGLTLAQTFVQQNDGMIDFDSRPGRTDFRILLPLLEARRNAPAA